MLVRPAARLDSASNTLFSVLLSRALVASSNSSMVGALRNALGCGRVGGRQAAWEVQDREGHAHASARCVRQVGAEAHPTHPNSVV